MNINTIFYFPDSLTFGRYIQMLNEQQISPRTIVFAKSQNAIYKGGKKYGGVSEQEFNDIIDAVRNDTYINEQITEIKQDVLDASSRVDSLDQRITTLSNALDQEIATKGNDVQAEVESLMQDSEWVQTNFPQGVTGWDSRWNAELDAYLQTVGYWTSGDNGQKITQWSKLTQAVNRIETSINSLKQDGLLTQALSASIQQLINDNIASLELGTTYARTTDVDDVQKIIEWMYSGFKTQTWPDKTFSQLASMAKNDFVSAISDIRTQVQKVKDGDYVAQTEIASKVKNTVSSMLLESSSENGLAAMSARLDQVEQDENDNSSNISSIILGITGSSSTADIQTRISNALSGISSYSGMEEAKAEVYSAISAKDENDQFISLAALKTQSDADHSSISGIATRVTDLETNEAGWLAKTDLDTSVAELFAQNSSTKSGVATQISNNLDSAKTEIYTAIGAKDNNDNFISLASLKTQSDSDHSSISGITTRVGTLETNQSGFVANSNLDSAVAQMFASSGNGQNSDAKANIVALVKDRKSQLELNATDVNINGYLSAGGATFKGDVQATSFTTGGENEIGIGVMSGEFNELLANTNKAYFAYDSTQGGITMWYYQNNEWKRLDLTSASVVDSADAFQPTTFYVIQDESIEIIPKNLPTVTLYKNRVTEKYYNTTSTSDPATGTYYIISNYGSGEGQMFYIDSVYKSDYTEQDCDTCSIKEHKSDGTIVNSGAVSDSTNRSFSVSRYTITNGSVTSSASTYVKVAVSDIYVNSRGRVTSTVVAPIVVKFKNDHLMWNTTGTNYPLQTVTPTDGNLGTHQASVHAISIDGRRLNGTNSSYARPYADINWIRTSLQDSFNTFESQGGILPYRYTIYTNHVRTWLYHDQGTVKYPDSSGYPY